MPPSAITVRPLASEAERERYYLLADQAFNSEPSEADAHEWAAFTRSLEEYDPTMERGAFRDETLLGGYVIFPRQVRIGNALVPTGCIASVVTDPDQRLGGVATTFLHDADAFARQRGDALILLDGIPHFYHHFDYIKVTDASEVVLARAALADLPLSDVVVRPATQADVSALHALYHVAYRATTGSFARTERQQSEKLTRRIENPPFVAVQPDGTFSGYLSTREDAPRNRAFEVIATDAATISALLRFHHDLAPEEDLEWILPLHTPLYYWLHDHLTIPGYERHTDPRFISAVTTRISHQNDTAWMAKIADLGALQTALLPEWQRRWAAAQPGWRGTLAITVGDQGTVTFTADAQGIGLGVATPAPDLAVRVTAGQFTQLVFGYRPVAWLAEQIDAEGSAAALPLLNVLFPMSWPLIPSSDGF